MTDKKQIKKMKKSTGKGRGTPPMKGPTPVANPKPEARFGGKKMKNKSANMGGWNHKDCFKDKQCLICEKSFTPKSGVHKFCSESCKGKWKYISGEMTTESQYKYISGNWKRYFARLVGRCHSRESLSVETLIDILEKQENKCALSGVELTCKLEKGVKSKTNASIDRIEAGGPYIKENIQLVCSVLNKFRVDTELNEFIWWCKKVTENQND